MFDKYMSIPPVTLNAVSQVLFQKFQLEPKLSSLCVLTEQVPPTGGFLLAEYIQSSGWGKVWLELFHEQLTKMGVVSNVAESNLVLGEQIKNYANSFTYYANLTEELKDCVGFLTTAIQSYHQLFLTPPQPIVTPLSGTKEFIRGTSITPAAPITVVLSNGTQLSLDDYIRTHRNFSGVRLVELKVDISVQLEVSGLIAMLKQRLQSDFSFENVVTAYLDALDSNSTNRFSIHQWSCIGDFIQRLLNICARPKTNLTWANVLAANNSPQVFGADTETNFSVPQVSDPAMDRLGKDLRAQGVDAVEHLTDEQLGIAWMVDADGDSPDVTFIVTGKHTVDNIKAVIDLIPDRHDSGLGLDPLPKSYCLEVLKQTANKLPSISARIGNRKIVETLPDIALALRKKEKVEILRSDRKAKEWLYRLTGRGQCIDQPSIFLTDLNVWLESFTELDWDVYNDITTLEFLANCAAR